MDNLRLISILDGLYSDKNYYLDSIKRLEEQLEKVPKTIEEYKKGIQEIDILLATLEPFKS